MGQFRYGSPAATLEIEDRTLAHLQIVIVNKYRRDESFTLHLEIPMAEGSGRSTLWMHPAIPVQFVFSGGRLPSVNQQWLQALMDEANSGRGLRIVREPEGARSGGE